MKAFLQGRWLGHPLHAIFVHYPVGLWVFSLALDVITRFSSPNNALVIGSFYAMLGGTGIALLAAVTGLADWSDIRRDHEARQPATLHMIINLTAIGLYVVNLVLRYASLDGGRVPLLQIALSVLGVGAISVSGYLGGLVVYDDGAGVGRHRRKTELPDETVKAGGAGEWVEVGDANSLAEGETLRAEVGGHVMAVVKS